MPVVGRGYMVENVRQTPQGPVKREIIVEGRQGLIVEQRIYDPRGQLMAVANIDHFSRDALTGYFMPSQIRVRLVSPPPRNRSRWTSTSAKCRSTGRAATSNSGRCRLTRVHRRSTCADRIERCSVPKRSVGDFGRGSPWRDADFRGFIPGQDHSEVRRRGTQVARQS